MTYMNIFRWPDCGRLAMGGRLLPFLMLGLFVGASVSPIVRATDCNSNSIDDACDINCGTSGGPCDVAGCGQSADCNSNGIPDECDIAAGAMDLNHDGVPDSCVFSLPYERVKPCGNFYLSPDDATDYLRAFDRSGNPVATFSSVSVSDIGGPLGCDASGNIMIPDWNNDRVRVISPTGALELTISGGGLDGPTGTAVTPSGGIAVCSYLTDSIRFYSAAGVYQSNLGHFTGTEDPQSIIFDRAKNLYVGCRNNGNPHIAKFNPQLQFVQYMGQGQFDQGCTDMAFDANENLYVVTIGSVKKFAHDGTYLATISQAGLSPLGIAIDDTEVLWVTNNFALNVYRFSTTGTYLDTVSISYGVSPPAGLKLYGIAFDVRPADDCNTNGTADSCDIFGGTAQDCDLDGVPDSCQLAGEDCNSNGIPDHCESGDCDTNGTPDLCEVLGGAPDCNSNEIPDSCELTTTILADSYADFSGSQGNNGWYYGYYTTPFNSASFQPLTRFGPDGDFSGITTWHLQLGSGGFYTAIGQSVAHPNGPTSSGGRQNVAHWACRRWISSQTGTVQITGSFSKADAQGCGGCDGCRGRIIVDGVEIWNQFLAQTDGVGYTFNLPQALAAGSTVDFVLDPIGYDGKDLSYFSAIIAGGDCNNNGILDECDIASSESDDCNSNGVPDECESQADCNSNSVQDICEPGGVNDCDLDGLSDLCELAGGATDCNSNQVPDSCDVVNANDALDFDGSNDVVRIPHSASLDPANNLTLECWIRPDSVGATNSRIIRNQAGAGYILSWRQSGLNRLQLRIDKGTGNVEVTDTVDTSTYFGAWTHVAAVYSATGNFAQLYVNGVLKASTTTSGPLLYSNADVGIGNSTSPSEAFDGLIDEVRIWSVARSGTQIAADMHKSLVAPQPGLVGYWRFDDGSGQTAVDSSGLDHDGILGTSAGTDANDPTWLSTGNGTASAADCDSNGIPDSCDIAGGATDCNTNGVLDTCEADCNANGIADDCDVSGGMPDCNSNGSPDSCDIANGTSTDANTDGVPDSCQPDVHVAPVVTLINPATTTEIRSSLPSSASAVVRGGTYYVEIWASDVGSTNTGLTGVYVDVAFCSQSTAHAVFHGDTYTVFSSGTISAGLVDEFGGSTFSSGVGEEPNWVRIGWIRMTANSETASCPVAVQPSTSGVAAFGRGDVNWNFVQLDSVDLEIQPSVKTYDLTGNGFINVGDLSLFSPSWQLDVPPANTAHDFDCDDFVGVSDLSWFATGWLKNTTDPTILYPPCPMAFPALARSRAVASTDVDLRLVVRASPSGSDSSASLPTSVIGVSVGSHYYVEVWASDIGDINTGLTSGYIDLEVPAAGSSVANVFHGSTFTLFTNGLAGSGIVNELGGSTLPGGVGVQPQWVRVAYVEMVADSTAPTAVFSLAPSHTGVAALGRGSIPWDQIVLNGAVIRQGLRGDIDGDGDVDPIDMDLFVSVLLGTDLTAAYHTASDFSGDGITDGRDLQGFVPCYIAGGSCP